MIKTLTTSSLYRKRSKAPYIRVSGRWLREAGIDVGTRITVQVNHAGILITPTCICDTPHGGAIYCPQHGKVW